MMRRKGVGDESKVVIMEVIGALMLILLLTLLFAHFFGQSLGCFGNQECMEAQRELQKFVDDVNEACKNGGLGEEDAGILGEYDFGAADKLVIPEESTFRLADYENVDDIPYTPKKFLAKEAFSPGGATKNWEIEMKAEDCQDTFSCGLLRPDAVGCHKKYFIGDPVKDNVKFEYLSTVRENGLDGWYFWFSGGSSGKFKFHVPAEGWINLKWIGDKNLDQQIKSSKAWCEYYVKGGYCFTNPGGNWLEEHPGCEPYKDDLFGGSETCGGSSDDSSASTDGDSCGPGAGGSVMYYCASGDTPGCIEKSEYNDQCTEGGEVCCQSIGSP